FRASCQATEACPLVYLYTSPLFPSSINASTRTPRGAFSCVCCNYYAVGLESRTPKKKGVNKNVIHANPAFLETLAQSHSGWIFGAIAEIVDNSKDAQASKLDISVETHFSEMHGAKIPFLSLIDDGCGMSHDELVVMLSLGNKKFHEYDRERIGKYGIGFKTGAMKLGSDVMVLTQTAESRSVAFLSQTYSKDKDELDLPIVSYRRNGSVMKLDTDVQTKTTANRYLSIMEKFSPFDQYFIGGKFALFGESGQGTQVYIWNLEKSGLDFSLEWLRSNDGDTNKDDIIIRSKRTRQRFGQLGQKVPLDYSLRAYLEVIFLNPRMKISIQGSVVKSRLVAKSLVKTATVDGVIQGKPVQLILGHCHEEWERLNSGIFLYWHGRLIEAYKRVGGMVQNSEKSRGVIGVADVTDVMRERGRDLVHNTKQAFEECKAYEELEKWLGNEFDSYCNAYSEQPRGTCGIPNMSYNLQYRKWQLLALRVIQHRAIAPGICCPTLTWKMHLL
ncbi:hypothetical protein MKW94_029049, partial [Papaver nudicaule]|nr:hypothetical protein [Papaver nudicaule]